MAVAAEAERPCHSVNTKITEQSYPSVFCQLLSHATRQITIFTYCWETKAHLILVYNFLPFPKNESNLMCLKTRPLKPF